MRSSLRVCSVLFAAVAFAQTPVLTTPPSGNNQKASVSQFIGPVKITIDYSSPAVHSPSGEDRRGKIWGQLVPYGLSAQGIGASKDVPWRAGAMENTTFAASEDVAIEGKPLAAGIYGLHMIPDAGQWTIIFNKNANAWGSFFYDEREDTLRVTVTPRKHDYREWLTYEFPVRKPSEATAELQWEDLAVPFNIKPTLIISYITHPRCELTGGAGFDFRAYLAAAQYCLAANTDLDQGLAWAEAAVSKQSARRTSTL